MSSVSEEIANTSFNTNEQEAEITLAKEEFDDYMKKLCAAESDPEVILDRLYEAKNDASHVRKYKLMAMLGDEIEKRETVEENEEDFEEAAA